MSTSPSNERFSVNTEPIHDVRINKLKKVFPEVWIEGKVQWDKLRETLGEFVENKNEVYSFTWTGKNDAQKILQKPSEATLVPCIKDSENFNKTKNVFIEGDNLEVMKLLFKKYHDKIKMIYLDPPYNTGNDLIYFDQYSDPLSAYLKISNQKDDFGNILSTNPETQGRYHSSWLSMMYPRLLMARELLKEDGVIFVSIDDNEIENLRMIMNEIFGEENFIDCIIWKKRYGGGAKEKYLVTLHEYILFYSKNINLIDNIYIPLDEASIKKYYTNKDEKYHIRGPYRTHPLEATKSVGERKNLVFPIPTPDGGEVWPERQWWWDKKRVMQSIKNNDLEFIKGKNGKINVHTKQYLKDKNGNIRKSKPFSIIDDVYTQHGTREIADLFGDSKIYPFPKPTKLIKKILEMTDLKNDDIIMDFFAGSCSTAHAILDYSLETKIKLNFICIQLPEPFPDNSVARNQGYVTISQFGKDRIKKIINKLKNLENDNVDLGYKYLKLNLSNFNLKTDIKLYNDDAKNGLKYIELLDKWVLNPIKEGVKDIDICYEILIKEGYDLNSEIINFNIGENKIYKIMEDNRELYVCIDSVINKFLVEELKKSVYKNSQWIFLDRSLTDDFKLTLNSYVQIKVI